MFGWGERPPRSAAEQLRSGSWTCATCDTQHGWPFDLAARTPDPWPGGDEYEPNGALRLEGDFLSEDFCVMDGIYFMIRAVLPIPVNGLEDNFGFGCWSTLSRDHFERYVANFNNGAYARAGALAGLADE